jgi:hypothetical protein
MTQNRKPEREQDYFALAHRAQAATSDHLERKADLDILYIDIDT